MNSMITTNGEIETGHGTTFSFSYQFGDASVFEGRVVWADSDHFEIPDWMYDFVKEQREKYKGKFDVVMRKGDKGYCELHFFPFKEKEEKN